MKTFILFFGVILTSGFARADIIWHLDKIEKIDVLESSPVQYDITYELACGDQEPQAMKFVTATETVIGMVAQQDTSVVCIAPYSVQTQRFQGESGDPTTVSILH